VYDGIQYKVNEGAARFGLEARVLEHGERGSASLYNRGLGRNPQRGPGAELLVRGSGANPPAADRLYKDQTFTITGKITYCTGVLLPPWLMGFSPLAPDKLRPWVTVYLHAHGALMKIKFGDLAQQWFRFYTL